MNWNLSLIDFIRVFSKRDFNSKTFNERWNAMRVMVDKRIDSYVSKTQEASRDRALEAV